MTKLVSQFKAMRRAPLPLSAMMYGKSPEEAERLLSSLFPAGGPALTQAARAALGLPQKPGGEDAIRAEALRDHLEKFCLRWPRHLALAPVAMPLVRTQTQRVFLFGPEPDWLDHPAKGMFRDACDSKGHVGRVLSALAQRFAPGDATCPPLAQATARSMFDLATPQENSVACRRLDHPAMRHVEAIWGRGPLWRALARALDVQALLENRFGVVTRTGPGYACVPTTRGLTGVRAEVAQGRVVSLSRATPTDHALASNGILDQSLARLPAAKSALSALVLEIVDPCGTVDLLPDTPR